MKKLLALILVILTVVSLGACGAAGEAEGPKVTFTITVVDEEGKETAFEIETTRTTVGDALLDEGLIEGEDSEYGMYIKSVNGILAEYETTGTYWAFYIDGEYAMTGVDQTKITEGTAYMLKVEKA